MQQDCNLPFLTEDEHQCWNQIRGWLMPDAARFLHQHAKEAMPEGQVVEIGSYAGKSTVCIAKALRENGRTMTAIDLRFRSDFLPNLRQLGLDKQVYQREGPSVDVFESWRGPISFLYIDGHHGKGYAMADLLLWDMFVLPGGVVALDDTAGFMIGPNLQIQVATASGCYTLLAEAGGVTFLRKNRPILPISFVPSSPATWFAVLHEMSAQLGAMDPFFRHPALPDNPKSSADIIDRFWNSSPSESVDLLKRKLRQAMRKFGLGNGRQQIASGAKDESAVALPPDLDWLSVNCPPSKECSFTIEYLKACHHMRNRRFSNSEVIFNRLIGECGDIDFIHYRLSIGSVSRLRLAQVFDLKGERAAAKAAYDELLASSSPAEIHAVAREGLANPFRIPGRDPKLLLRKYNLDWYARKNAVVPPFSVV